MPDQPDWVFYRDGKPTAADLMPRLVSEVPEFTVRWKEHLDYWDGEPAGEYNDIAEFARFVVDDLYPAKKTKEIQRAFDIMEWFLIAGNPQLQKLVVVGFLEDIQIIGSGRPFGSAAFITYLGPTSRKEWDELNRVWAGKTSLMEILEAEQKRRR